MEYPVPPLFSSRLQLEALAYWSAARSAGGAVPPFGAFNPCDVPHLLANVVLYDVLEGPRDFRYRLVGGEVRDRLHGNPVGMHCSMLPHQDQRSRIWRKLSEVADSGRPSYHAVEYIGPDTNVRGQQSLVLPYSRGGDRIDTLLAVAEFVRR